MSDQHPIIAALLIKHFSKTTTSAEEEKITAWLQEDEENKILYNSYLDSTRLKEKYADFDATDEAISWHRIMTAINKPVSAAHRVYFLKTTWFRYAAAIILIAGVAGYGWFSSSKQRNQMNQRQSTVQTITPGGNRAMLTIGNKTINLSNNKTGITVNNNVAYNDGEKITTSFVIPEGNLLQLSTPRGGQYQAVLPDGSKIWLNAASSIRFPSKFEGNERKVEVTGEVYLEIAKNTKQPFMVKANGTEVQVLGTSFNIDAYGDEGAIKTTLVEGSVKVKAFGRGVLLAPGQQAVVKGLLETPGGSGRTEYFSSPNGRDDGGGERILIQTTNVEQAIAWKNGLFSFEDASIQTVMRQISRWYDVEIVYEGKLSKAVFEGKIQRTLQLSQVLKNLEQSDVHFKMDGKKIIVTP